MIKIVILASIFVATSCADDGAKKKKKTSAQPQQVQQENNNSNSTPQSADGMLGSVQNQQNQNNQSQNGQSQNDANPLAGILGGLNSPGNPLSGLLQQFMGGAGGAGGGLDPSMLQGLLGGGGAGGMDISKLMQMLPQMQGMNIGALMNQAGANSAGLRGDDTDPALFALADLLASEHQKSSGVHKKRGYEGVEIVCLSSMDIDAFITVKLIGDSQKFYGTRSLKCSKFKIVFPNLEDGDYDLHVAFKSTAGSQQDIELNVFAQDGQISDRLDF